MRDDQTTSIRAALWRNLRRRPLGELAALAAISVLYPLCGVARLLFRRSPGARGEWIER